jgi:hypothetical protein
MNRNAAARALPGDRALDELLARARPSVAEVLSLWPASRRKDVVVWVRIDQEGETTIDARLREPHLDHAVPRIRGDAAVVFELGSDRRVVLPSRSLRG